MIKGWELINNITDFIDENFIGIYALSRNGINIDFIGRTVCDLAGRITGANEEGNAYTHFAYEYAENEMSAYLLECRYYHVCLPPGNRFHPVPPAGTFYQCPVKRCKTNNKLNICKSKLRAD